MATSRRRSSSGFSEKKETEQTPPVPEVETVETEPAEEILSAKISESFSTQVEPEVEEEVKIPDPEPTPTPVPEPPVLRAPNPPAQPVVKKHPRNIPKFSSTRTKQ